MAMIEIDTSPSARTLRHFGWMLLVFFGLIGGLAWWRFDAPTVSRGLWIAGASVGALYFAVPRLRRPIYLGWIYAALPLGWLVSHAVMAIVYYGVVTPIGLVSRAFGRDALQRTIDRDASTYWIERSETAEPERYFEQF